MPTSREIYFTILFPAAISLLMMLVAWRPWSNSSPRGYWAGAVAIGVSFSVGVLGLQKMPPLPPNSAQDWLFHIGWMIAIYGLIDGLIRLPMLVRLLVAAAASAATITLILLVKRSDGWGTQEPAIWIGCVTAAMVIVFWLFERASEKLKDATVPMLMTMAAGGLALYLALNGSQTFGQRAGIIAVALTAIVPLAWWAKQHSLARGGVLAFILLFGGMLATGYVYLDHVVVYEMLLVAASPLIGLVPLLTKLRGWKRSVACVLLAAIPLGIAVGLSGVRFAHEMSAEKESAES